MDVKLRCAVYTRKSTDEGLEKDFNSLQAQRESCEAYIRSQQHEGWECLSEQYDDGGFSGGNTERPGFKKLLADIEAGGINTVIVYKVDRLTRSLGDFSKIIEVFDRHKVSFVSVTQQFNTTNSMGRLTLNMLLSFAQFEREVTAERIRDKIAASKAKGMWMGGRPPLGYDIVERKLVINPEEACHVKALFEQYLILKSVLQLREWSERSGYRAKQFLATKSGLVRGGKPYELHNLYKLLQNPLYVGRILHKGQLFVGEQHAIIEPNLWDQVQTILQANAQTKESSLRTQSPSRLKGKLFDEHGQYMSPSHCRKGTRRYRYYTSQTLLKSRSTAASDFRGRIAAGEIDGIIEEVFVELLVDEGQIRKLLSHEGADLQVKCLRHAQQWSENWPHFNLSRQNVLLRSVLEKVILRKEEVEIRFNTQALKRILHDPCLAPEELKPAYNESSCSLKIIKPTRLLKRRENKSLVLENGTMQLPTQPDPELVRAICKGYRLNQLMLKAGNQRPQDIFSQLGIDRWTAPKLMQLAWLSPKVVQAVIDGEAPEDLSVRELLRLKEPLWSKQEKRFILPADRYDGTGRGISKESDVPE